MFDLTPYGRRNQFFNPFREMDNLEKHLFGGLGFSEFKTDITEKDDAYLLEADLPGFRKEDIHVDVENNFLVIRAERTAREEKEEEGKTIYRERSYGSFSRSFDISNVDADRIQARYADGVLTLTLPKKVADTPAARHLEIQ
ncbi:MAG: hypothetical protein DBX44_08445 [Oscillospiraceae bacterium]|nr:MAG: hypothetical protein DBX44_08445 [Oscillospiraceae bacterium]